MGGGAGMGLGAAGSGAGGVGLAQPHSTIAKAQIENPIGFIVNLPRGWQRGARPFVVITSLARRNASTLNRRAGVPSPTSEAESYAKARACELHLRASGGTECGKTDARHIPGR